MAGRASLMRLCALLSAGVFGVHQLRYVIVHGSDVSAALEHEGHAYLSFVGPVVAVTLTLLATHLLWRLLGGGETRRTASVPVMAAVFAVALLGIYTAQELLEGQLAAGHANGFAGVFGSGGLVAIPLSMLLGLAVAWFCHAAAVAGGASLLPRRALRPPFGTELVVACGTAPVCQPPSPLASHLAGRAPPGAAL